MLILGTWTDVKRAMMNKPEQSEAFLSLWRGKKMGSRLRRALLNLLGIARLSGF